MKLKQIGRKQSAFSACNIFPNRIFVELSHHFNLSNKQEISKLWQTEVKSVV